MAPRRITPGQVWFVTRRTTRRHFLLRPDPDGTSQNIYWYTTAVLAKKFGILIHAVQVMSTHIHEVLTDTRGELPNFIRERNRALANAIKCHRTWPEEVFQRAPASCIEVHGPAAILRQIGYTLANCVEAGLVDSPNEWPGPTVVAEDIGARTVVATRPSVYFDPENEVWPERIELAIGMPSELLSAYGSRAADELGRAVHLAIERAKDAARAVGKVIGTARQAMAAPFQKRAASFEQFGKRYPHFAAGGAADFARHALHVRRQFLLAYRRALDAWREGQHTVAFPTGTWRWCRELGATTPAKISMSVGST